MRLFSLHDIPFLMTQWDTMYLALCRQYKHYRLDIQAIYPAQLHDQKLTYIRLLNKALTEQSYQPQNAQARELFLGKWRHTYDIAITDRLLHTIWVNLLNAYLERHLTPHCHAYRKGKNFFEAVRECATFVRKHKKNKQINLYVLRSDISGYAASIPVHPASPLWPSLKNLIEKNHHEPLSEYQWSLLIQLLRPEITLTDGATCHNLYGIPFGTPLCSPIYNLYLHPLDQYLASIPGGYYCRYSDDFVFMHPDPDVLLNVDQKINQILTALSLARNTKKESMLYLTIAGRACEQKPFHGTHAFPFLGFSIQATGTIALNKEKNRQLIRYFRKLLSAAESCLAHCSASEKAQQLCQMLNKNFAYQPDKDISDKNVFTRLSSCTDRLFFKKIDHELALAVAESATGLKGQAAFAKISYHHIRHRFGLQSLCALKNQGML